MCGRATASVEILGYPKDVSEVLGSPKGSVRGILKTILRSLKDQCKMFKGFVSSYGEWNPEECL